LKRRYKLDENRKRINVIYHFFFQAKITQQVLHLILVDLYITLHLCHYNPYLKRTLFFSVINQITKKRKKRKEILKGV
jgi:hypothetical protein